MNAKSGISDGMWVKTMGGTCGLIILLVSVLGSFMLTSIADLQDEMKMFRIEFAERKGETVTWEKFTKAREEIKRANITEIKVLLAEHVQSLTHIRDDNRRPK